MPDVTITFTDAQWTRVVAATPVIKRVGDAGDVDAAYLANTFKTMVTEWVKEYELSQQTTEDF